MDRKKIARRLARIAVALVSGTSMRKADLTTGSDKDSKIDQFVKIMKSLGSSDSAKESAVDLMGLYLDDVRNSKYNTLVYSKVTNKIEQFFTDLVKGNISDKETQDFVNFLQAEHPTYDELFKHIMKMEIKRAEKNSKSTNLKSRESAIRFLDAFQKRSRIFEHFVFSKFQRFNTLTHNQKSNGTAPGDVPIASGGSELSNLKYFFFDFKNYVERLNHLKVKVGGSTTGRSNPGSQDLTVTRGNGAWKETQFNDQIDTIDQLTLELSSKWDGNRSVTLPGKNLVYQILANTTVNIGGTTQGLPFNLSPNDYSMEVFYDAFIALMQPTYTKEKEFFEVQNEYCKQMLASLNMTMVVATSQIHSGGAHDTLNKLKKIANASSQQWMKLIPNIRQEDFEYEDLIGIIQEIDGMVVAYDNTFSQKFAKAIEIRNQALIQCDSLRKKVINQTNAIKGKNKKSSIIAADEAGGEDTIAVIDSLIASLNSLSSISEEVNDLYRQAYDDIENKIGEYVAVVEKHYNADSKLFDELKTLFSQFTEALKHMDRICDSIIKSSESSTGQNDFGVVDNTVDDYDVAASEDDDDL